MPEINTSYFPTTNIINPSYMFYNDTDLDILSPFQVAKLLGVTKEEVYRDYIEKYGLIFVKDVLSTKRWYVFRRDLINFVSAILGTKIDTVYTRYYENILPYCGDYISVIKLKNILDLSKVEHAIDIITNNPELDYGYIDRCLYVTKYSFLRMMWLHRRIIPSNYIPGGIMYIENPDIYYNPINLFNPRVDPFIPHAKKIINPMIRIDKSNSKKGSNKDCFFNK